MLLEDSLVHKPVSGSSLVYLCTEITYYEKSNMSIFKARAPCNHVSPTEAVACYYVHAPKNKNKKNKKLSK